MNFIEEVLTKCQKDNKVDFVSALLAIVFFFILFPIIIYFFNESGFLITILIIGIFLMPTLGYIFGRKLGKKIFKLKKVDFSKTKLYKKLKKTGCLNEFIDTINKEINNENTIKYYDDILGVGLLVTETWFVFIDTTYPKFIKTNEIVKISDEQITSDSTFYMFLELKNKKRIKINKLSYIDIQKEIRAKYPNIKIGKR